MADITGSVVIGSQFGEQDASSTVLGKFDFSAALATVDTYTIPNFFPRGKKLFIESFEAYGDVFDTNETKTLAISVGNSDDPDGLLTSTVLNYTQKGVVICGDGAFVGGDALVDNTDLTLTVTANPATGATSGTLYFRVVARDRNK